MLSALAWAVVTLLLLAVQPVQCACQPSARASQPPVAAPPAPAPSVAAPSRRAPPTLSWEVVEVRPHDPDAWTQGLQLDGQGRLFESTGLRGRSSVREVDAASGAVRRQVALPKRHFGEGLAIVGDRLIQLTWQEGVANVWDAETFDRIDTFDFDGEGWGLCYDGRRLVMSDGSQRLTFRDPATFEVMGTLEVDGGTLPPLRLNELECVGDTVWANAWLTDTIVRIDPQGGRVTGVLDLAGLLEQWGPGPDAPAAPEPPDVLNGIAWDAAVGTFLVTGKRWPALFEIRVAEESVASEPPNVPQGRLAPDRGACYPAKGTRGRPGTSSRVRKRLPANG